MSARSLHCGCSEFRRNGEKQRRDAQIRCFHVDGMSMAPRGTLDAKRQAHRRERDVAVEVMRNLFLGDLFRCLGGYIVGLGT